MRTPLNLRRGFLCCAIGEIDRQDVSLIFLQFLNAWPERYA